MDTYEKKYNEALKRAKAAIDIAADKDLVEGVAATIFPELRESEDERMIKWVIKVLDEGYKAFFEMDYSKEDVLSWLEKKKEQKGLDVTDYCQPIHPDIAKVLPDVINELTWGEDEQKEQKPVDDNPLDDPRFTEGFDAGRTVQKIFDEPKPAEWSEEDREMLLSIINAFRNGTVSTIGQEQWLKSLPERFNLQPKQEWSEEDEKMLDSVIRLITHFDDLAHEPTYAGPKWTHPYTKEIAWLKSLRPHWKPSEEQMKCLLNALSVVNLCKEYEPLRELYEQLKKLMED